jgi:prepilin peptidase CpaA
MLATILLLGLVLTAAATDVAWHKIYNWTTYPGMVAALGLSATGFGLVPFWESVWGFLACGLLLLFCFVTFRVGGGDVKLLAMIGAFLGLASGMEAMLWTFVLGACMGLIVLVWRVGPWRLAARTFRQLMWSLRLGRWQPLTDDERAQLQPPLFLAPCALLAVIIVRFQLMRFVQGV